MKRVQISIGEVEIKELTFGDENNASRKAIERAQLESKKSIDIITKREYLLLESIVKAPFELNIETLHGLSRKDGLLMTGVFNELNEVVDPELTSSEPTSSKESIQKENSESGQEK
jgi:hypothetical protein